MTNQMRKVRKSKVVRNNKERETLGEIRIVSTDQACENQHGCSLRPQGCKLARDILNLLNNCFKAIAA